MPRDKDEILRLAGEAAMIYNHPLTQGFIEAYDKKLFSIWVGEPDPQIRDDIWNQYQAALQFKQHFFNYLASGKLAERKEAYSIADSIGPLI
jgi:hypothetical protein